MNVLIAGGSGFIGAALTRSLLADGHKVWVLTRNPSRLRLPVGAQPIRWDGRTSQGWVGVFSQMEAVVNLAGETVGKWPWTQKRKQLIRESRVDAGLAIADAFQKVDKKPAVLIQASGIGYYGPCGAETIAEDSPAGNDFMASVAGGWEASTRIVDSLGVRRVIIRTSLVLNAKEGVLPLMALPVRFWVGGPLGNGKQGVSWIHIEDEVRAIRYLLENEKARGAFNLCAPNPMPNAEFIRFLAMVLSRPSWFPIPALVLKTALGEMSTLLLDGQFAIPQRLVNLGFVFHFETAQEAFRDLF
jgi:uncharacterized protein (TIGR01777 family)